MHLLPALPNISNNEFDVEEKMRHNTKSYISFLRSGNLQRQYFGLIVTFKKAYLKDSTTCNLFSNYRFELHFESCEIRFIGSIIRTIRFHINILCN